MIENRSCVVINVNTEIGNMIETTSCVVINANTEIGTFSHHRVQSEFFLQYVDLKELNTIQTF